MSAVKDRTLTPNIAIRQASLNDLPTLVDHNLKMWELDPGEDRPDQLGIHKAFFKAHKHFGAFVAEDRSDPQNPRPIGSVISYKRHSDAPIADTSKKRGTIALLYVSDEYRRQGIGEALMEQALNHLEKAGCDRVGIYGTPEGMALYKKLGFIHKPEMRLKFSTTQGAQPPERKSKPLLSPLQSHGESARITVRKADLKSNEDVRLLIGHEKGISVADPTLRHPLDAYKSYRDVRAYKKFVGEQQASQAFIAEQGSSPIGSILVGEWKYPVPPVFTSESRKDLFTTSVHTRDPQAASTLLEAAIKYGEGNEFTQFNVGDAQKHEGLLESHGFKKGIKMERDLHPQTTRQRFQEKTASLYRL